MWLFVLIGIAFFIGSVLRVWVSLFLLVLFMCVVSVGCGFVFCCCEVVSLLLCWRCCVFVVCDMC